jgi:hypothetical protein
VTYDELAARYSCPDWSAYALNPRDQAQVDWLMPDPVGGMCVRPAGAQERGWRGQESPLRSRLTHIVNVTHECNELPSNELRPVLGQPASVESHPEG